MKHKLITMKFGIFLFCLQKLMIKKARKKAKAALKVLTLLAMKFCECIKLFFHQGVGGQDVALTLASTTNLFFLKPRPLFRRFQTH